MCGFRMLAAKNSRKRIDARSPATVTSAGSVGKLIGTSWFMHPLGTALPADNLFVNDLVRREPGALVARARCRIRGQGEKAQARDTGLAEILFDRREQLVCDPLPAIGGHHTDIGEVTEPVRVRGLFDVVVFDNPADSEAGERAAEFGHHHGAALFLGLPLQPYQVSVRDLLAGQSCCVQPALMVLQLDDRPSQVGRVGRRRRSNNKLIHTLPRTRSARRRRPMRSITRPISPRCRSGLGTPTSPPPASTITARRGRKTARRSR